MDGWGPFWRQRRSKFGPVYTGPTQRARQRRWRTPRGLWLALVILLGVAVAALVVEGLGGGREAAAAFGPCARGERQACVVDGDTIRYRGTTIRLADIDAPEVFSPKCASEKALGDRATRRLVELMNDGPFELMRSGGRDTDRYGRKLRVVVRDGRSLADILIAEGLARRWNGARRSWCE